MNFVSFFVESVRVASKSGRADYQVDLDSAERLINKYCGGRRDWQGRLAPSRRDTFVRDPLPDLAWIEKKIVTADGRDKNTSC